jgi:hypothetical protein
MPTGWAMRMVSTSGAAQRSSTPTATWWSVHPILKMPLTIAEIDLNQLHRSRARLPLLRDERTILVQRELERILGEIMIDLKINTELTEKILTGFIRSELNRVGLQSALLGVSGGIDSAVSLYLSAKALGPENVLGIRMPYKTSPQTHPG